MKCLRCGYCCIEYAVMIIRDVSKPVVEDSSLPMKESNVMYKESGVRCPHLVGKGPGQYSCAAHDHPYYPKTPCHEFGQAEESPDTPCRLGVFVLSKMQLTAKE